MPDLDLLIWWLCFVVAAGLIPAIIIAYLLFPARTRITRTHEVIARLEQSPKLDKRSKAVLGQSKEATLKYITEFFGARNYALPVTILVLVLGVGFFLIFSFVYPLYKFRILDEIILTVPNSVVYGFIGAWFFGLYSVLQRYHTADISPLLVFQLAYQLLLSAGVAYFAVTLTPELMDPGVAFAAGFIPYRELTGWLRHTAQTRLGTNHLLKPLQKENDKDTTPTIAPQFGSHSLVEVQGLSAEHRERLADEGIFNIQNLAMANPLSLYLVTSYSMSEIVDWIDQAYLLMYLSGDTIARLTPLGVRCSIEFAYVNNYLNGLPTDAEKEAFLKALATALDTDSAGVRYLIVQLSNDPQVGYLSVMWNEFGGT